VFQRAVSSTGRSLSCTIRRMGERTHEVTRLEGFSDAVFGFALTLLVVSLETPQSITALRELARGFFPFALTFAMVCWIWYEHNVFFRRYGLQDPWTVFLNSVLLFVVLFYVYPLKFITSTLFNVMVWRSGPVDAFGSRDDSQMLMLLYSSGVVMIFGTFVLLYRHAWRRRVPLALSPVALLQLRYGARAHLISTSLGIMSLVIAIASPGLAGVAGLIYCLMGPLHGWNGYAAGKATHLLKQKDAEAG
jgi:uncharacterized membrane protein